MEGKELYKKYAGRKASCFWDDEFTIGTVVGYDKEDLIMAVEEGDNGWWFGDEYSEFVEDSWIDNKKGFLYIDEGCILPEEEA